MSRYDGLIIPRSYNDYFSRSDPQAIQRVVKMATDETLNINSENPIQNKAVAKLVPATASETNQLADKNFVNSTVGTNTANYIYKTVEGENVPFDSVAELEAYTGTVTQNDYAFVTGIDDDGNRYYDRYKANETEGVITWGKEYRLNNSSFTAEQWAAIESGITAEKIAAYDAGITPPVDYVEAEEMAPVTSNAVANELETNYYNKQSVDYQLNETVKLINRSFCVASGIITGSAKTINLSLHLPKKLHDYNISITSLQGRLRGHEGYIHNGADIQFISNEFNVSVTKIYESEILITITKKNDTVWTNYNGGNVLNNTNVTLNVTAFNFTVTD